MEERSMLRGFRQFILRGNVVDLAVAVVIGTAFGVVIAAIVKDLLTPLIAAIVGKPDFSNLTFTVNNSTFRYGDVINAVITFLGVAAAVYFIVVMPMARLQRLRSQPPVEATTRPCPECLSDIPKAARRCAFCTTQLTPAA
jgi:large conductance mechanosensitive channel